MLNDASFCLKAKMLVQSELHALNYNGCTMNYLYLE